MKLVKITAAAGLALVACQALASMGDTGTADITATSAMPVTDQLIECIVDEGPGITTTDFFVITKGTVKRYSRTMNLARDMCMPGQPDCALGWRDDKIAMDFAMPDGARHAAVIDLENRSIAKTQTSAEGDKQTLAGTCSSKAIPAGITID